MAVTKFCGLWVYAIQDQITLSVIVPLYVSLVYIYIRGVIKIIAKESVIKKNQIKM